jgi:large subunit ribosomal protein L25
MVRGAPEGVMMDIIQIAASPRSVIGKQVKVLRRTGLLPAILYGVGMEPQTLELPAHETELILQNISGSTLIDLKVGSKTHKVLIREVQRDVISRKPIHVDFLEVAMDVTINAVVPIEFVGEAPAVRDLGGVLVSGLNDIEVEALPSNLPDRISVDLSMLETFDDSITVADLKVEEGVTILTELDEAIANVVYQMEEEEPEEIEELLEEVEPELVDREEGEEEAAEGEASEE